MADEETAMSEKFKKWPDDVAEKHFQQMERLRAYPPGGLFDQLEFMDHVDGIFERIEASDDTRLIVLESWLLIDYIVTYLLRDALGIPESFDKELKLLPFSFMKKIELIKKIIDIEEVKLPNQRSYQAYELHPEFQGELDKDKALYERFMQMAIVFEETRCPREAYSLMRGDFERARFVPEWWYERARELGPNWFQNCRQLNKARNLVAHSMKMENDEVFTQFDVPCMTDFKAAVRAMIESVIFKREV